MPLRRWWVSAALAAVVGVGGCGSIRPERYEYAEEIDLALDGSATVRVSASEAALVALRGAPIDPSPESRPNREALRAFYSGPGVTVQTPTFSRRDGRRFVHITLVLDDVHRLGTLAPFNWSTYRLTRAGDVVTFRQRTGGPTRKPVAGPAWTGTERVAFRMQIPSRVLFENATTDVLRGNIVVWVQPLADRLAGRPVDIEVRMESESILRHTLLMFAATIVAAAATFAIVIWWVIRRGRRANDAAV
jgi:hypothetical protein